MLTHQHSKARSIPTLNKNKNYINFKWLALKKFGVPANLRQYFEWSCQFNLHLFRISAATRRNFSTSFSAARSLIRAISFAG
jgi:hypothetical protein